MSYGPLVVCYGRMYLYKYTNRSQLWSVTGDFKDLLNRSNRFHLKELFPFLMITEVKY